MKRRKPEPSARPAGSGAAEPDPARALAAARSAIVGRPGFDANRVRISLALSQFTVPLLSSVYRQFAGDVVAAIVLGEIAHRNVEAWLNDERNPEAALYDLDHRRLAVMRPCNALSIAEACGIPRETVRRKVVQLIDRGLIDRDPSGHLFLNRDVGEGLQDSTLATIDALLTTARRLESLLAGRPTPLGPLRVD
ncbi:MAG: hypothetical protein ACK5Y0_10275 [Pseudomonadota bacterium]